MQSFLKRYSIYTISVWLAGFITIFFILFKAAAADKPSENIFSHKVHSEENLECIVCHTNTETSEKGTDNLLPGKPVCAECHDVEDPNGCAKCHSDKENMRALEQITDYSPKFSHAAHHKIEAGCERCHQGVSSSDSSYAAHLPSMETCMACHDGKTADKSCITCHEKPEGKLPADHQPKEWIIDHVFEYSVDMGNSCKMCHTNQQCQRCHLDKELLAP
ncbi:MAG TPA: cytochrome c3 family protein [Candidatus Bathyarchaeia archaeon]|nr:cytochrome c3 family protein [Candidatus Bathyarchaeia archaeon]